MSLPWLVLLMPAFSSCINIQLLQHVSHSLERTLDFVDAHQDSMNADAILGIAMAKGFLDAIDEVKYPDPKKLEVLREKAEKICNETKPGLVRSANGSGKLLTQQLVDPSRWRPTTFTNEHFNQNLVPQAQPKVHSFADLRLYLSSRKINEEFSDNCLVELLSGCRTSQKCRQVMMISNHMDPTYGITHKLLYLQIARSWSCGIDEAFIKARGTMYCSYMIWEARMFDGYKILPELVDLLLEQMTLCSLEGYSDFFTSKWIKLLLGMQNSAGCFPKHSKDENREKMKRTSNTIEYGCSDHTTGVAASALSALLKYLSSY